MGKIRYPFQNHAGPQQSRVDGLDPRGGRNRVKVFLSQNRQLAYVSDFGKAGVLRERPGTGGARKAAVPFTF